MGTDFIVTFNKVNLNIQTSDKFFHRAGSAISWVVWRAWHNCEIIGINSIYPFQFKGEILTTSDSKLRKNLKIVNMYISATCILEIDYEFYNLN